MKIKERSLYYYPFKHSLQTRWKDVDSFKHINNAVFATYIEDARCVFFKRWGIIGDSKSIVLASIKIDFLHQLSHPSEIIIGQKIVRIGKTSFDIESAIYIKNKASMIAISEASCVCFDFIRNQPLLVYPEIISDYILSETKK